MRSYVTINTDASFIHSKGVGGFGIWIVCDEFVIKQSGKFKEVISDANESEIKALINAFHLIEGRLTNDYTVVINCDNKVARDIINGRHIPKRFINEAAILRSYSEKYKKVYAKHINGHRRGTSARQSVNNWCDQASRKHCRE